MDVHLAIYVCGYYHYYCFTKQLWTLWGVSHWNIKSAGRGKLPLPMSDPGGDRLPEERHTGSGQRPGTWEQDWREWEHGERLQAHRQRERGLTAWVSPASHFCRHTGNGKEAWPPGSHLLFSSAFAAGPQSHVALLPAAEVRLVPTGHSEGSCSGRLGAPSLPFWAYWHPYAHIWTKMFSCITKY